MTGADDLKTDVPHPARIYDYLLGGKDNVAADAMVKAAGALLPTSMRAHRGFMARVRSLRGGDGAPRARPRHRARTTPAVSGQGGARARRASDGRRGRR
jgi:hypothetical protein